jgi:hypothetical protein
VTHLTLDDLRKTDQMTERSVEDIVARLEANLFTVTQNDIRALIAALRERVAELQAETGYTDAIRAVARDENHRLRGALAEALDVLGQFITEDNGVMKRGRAALAAEPASGEIGTDPPRARQSTTGDPWADVRDEAFEEAAKIAELWAGMRGRIGAAIAAAIRARIKP